MITIELVCVVQKGADPSLITRSFLSFNSPPQLGKFLEKAGFTVGSSASAGLLPSIWGKRVPLDYLLQAGDRVELTGELVIDPKYARAHRVSTRPRRGWVQRIPTP